MTEEGELLMTDFLLNCFVLGDDEKRVFPVEIAKDKNVGILKDEIIFSASLWDGDPSDDAL